jgi:low temperature requirement protein LtrA
MFGIALMAASVPRVEDDKPLAFVLAYVWCRMIAAGSWKRTSRVLTELPAVQHVAGVALWIASLWFEPPLRYWLWAAAIVIDVVLSTVRSRDPARLLAAEQRETEEDRRRRFLRRRPRSGDVEPRRSPNWSTPRLPCQVGTVS